MATRSSAASRVLDEIKNEPGPGRAVQYAELSEIEDFATSLPENYLHCRELGHNWRPFTAGRYRDGGFERVLRCSRCRTRRVQEVSSRGMIVASKYIHPEGYLHKGMGRIVGEGRGLLRLESIQRIVLKAEELDG